MPIEQPEHRALNKLGSTAMGVLVPLGLTERSLLSLLSILKSELGELGDFGESCKVVAPS